MAGVAAMVACGPGVPVAEVLNTSSEVLTEVEITFAGQTTSSLAVPDVAAGDSQDYRLSVNCIYA